MLEISEGRAEREKQGLRGPEAWSAAQVVSFVRDLDGGKLAAIAPYFQNMTGRALSVEWLGHLERRVVAAGGTEEDASKIYEAFHALIANHKRTPGRP